VRQIDRRIGLMFGAFALVLVAAFARAAWLQTVKSGEYRALARAQQVSEVVVPGIRGSILDRHGQPLAVSEDAKTVIATPYQVRDPERTAAELAPLVGETQSEVLDSIDDRSSGFAYVAEAVPLDYAERIEDLALPGISTTPDVRRNYPQGPIAASLLGAVGSKNQGLSGLEAGYQARLGARDGRREIVYDARGNPLRFDVIEPGSRGTGLRTTIDASIQAKADEAVANVTRDYEAAGAAAIVMNPNTSEVLAMSSAPSFDPAHLERASEESLLNRPTGFTYEPGSTFKAFTVAGAIEDGLVTPETPYYLPSKLRVADRVIKEAHARPPITATVSQILAQSSNVGAVKVGQTLGEERFSKWVDRFGFGAPTRTGFPGEERGIVPPLSDYSGSSIGNLPIGQGLSATLIQMASAYSAIANGGVLHRPRLLEQAGGARERGRRIISERTASQVRAMLEGVLAPGGTASEVEVPGYTLAGKTGTAEKAVDGGYSETNYVASFVGFAPADKPEVLIAVLVDEPRSEIAGGVVAAPVVAEIASYTLPYLGVSPG